MTLWIFFAASSLALARVDSPYTPLLKSALSAWPPHTRVNPAPPTAIRLDCYSTPGNSSYIGVGQWLTIAAPLETVAHILDDFDHYADLFPDLKRVSIVSHEGPVLETSWEEDIPIFFIPNGKYRLTYWTDSAIPGRKTYRYQLVESGHLKQSDGMIVIEAAPGGTYYTELDFIDTNWGLLKTLAPGKIWAETISDIARSDLAIQLRAEHPEMSYSQIKDEAKKRLSSEAVDHCARVKHDFSLNDLMK
jgi:hypothetical protein